ncbi:MAG: arabinan endo-1,5-alpha-L-arabinosidase [Akkermansiaceae bacterium]|nr:arabinan endo-1,5-alpha-L-arabinosidase [Armatimonadota bacterium]
MLVQKQIFLLGFFLAALAVGSLSPSEGEQKKENAIRHVHDPCIIRQGDYYYVFSTGPGVLMRRSKDLIHWEFLGKAFDEDVPEWAKTEVPGSKALWAPDISFRHGRYYLYYSVSTFGKNRSVIGLATNRTLDPASPEYQWKQEGKVVESFLSSDYNAIDSNVVPLSDNQDALSFGSFWSGIKLVKIDSRTGKPAPGAPLVSLSQRPSPNAQEAPFIARRGGYFYLFVSFDTCCRGSDSTYNIRVGRAKTIEGPFVDRDGQSMMAGGGTPVLATKGRYIGPGHCAVLQEKGRDVLVNHFYDGESKGIPTLQVRPLRWDKTGWPDAGPPIE